LKEFTDFLLGFLHPFNLHLLEVLNLTISTSIDLQDFKMANYYCAISIPAYEHIYPPTWPLVGLQYYMKGKLDWFLENTDGAYKWLRKSLPILEITHGTDHSLVKQLVSLLSEVQAEYQYKHPLT